MAYDFNPKSIVVVVDGVPISGVDAVGVTIRTQSVRVASEDYRAAMAAEDREAVVEIYRNEGRLLVKGDMRLTIVSPDVFRFEIDTTGG